MKQELSFGQEVIIIQNGNYKNYKKGIVFGCELSDDLSYHGSPWYENIYKVSCEDGTIYKGCYQKAYVGSTFFITKEMYLNHLEFEITYNNEQLEKQIAKVKKENEYLQSLIDQFLEKEENKPLIKKL